MRKLRWLLLLVAFFAFTATAAAKTTHYFPTGRTCRASYVRRIVRVAERKHGRLVRRHHRVVHVRRLECVAKPQHKTVTTTPTTSTGTTTTPTVGATLPTIQYSSNVDPVVTQNPTSPLQTSIAYSADATSTSNGITTDLAAAGNLPIGVLNLYSTTSAAAGSELICSMNVGGSTTGGTCNITYPSLGTYFLTTQYIVSATNSVTSTESITVDPMPDTATLTVGTATSFVNPTGCTYPLGPGGPCDAAGSAGYIIGLNATATDPNATATWSATDVTTGQTFPGCEAAAVWTSIINKGVEQIPSGDVQVCGTNIASSDVVTQSVAFDADYANGFQPSSPTAPIQVWPIS